MKSLSILVGTSACNARCKDCAGVIHRANAPVNDGINIPLVRNVLESCFDDGARSLSISSSGEPTLSPKSVTQVVTLTNALKLRGKEYTKINMYTNGIKIGRDEDFAKYYLATWKNLGLTNVYVTVHALDELENAREYGVSTYPSLDLVFSRIIEENLRIRANVVLKRRTIPCAKKFIELANGLKEKRITEISCWPQRTMNDEVDYQNSTPREELQKIGEWARRNTTHDFGIRYLDEETKSAYTVGDKKTLFPDGTLSNKWCM